MIIEETIISSQTAVHAKEKGFDLICRHNYKMGTLTPYQKEYMDTTWITNPNTEFPNRYDLTSAPTQALLQRWLREKHNILVFIDYIGTSSDDYEFGYIIKYEEGTAKRQFERLKVIESLEFYSGGYSNPVFSPNDYEHALELGLQKALSLIKM